MLLRRLATHWLRQNAQERLYQAVSQAAGDAARAEPGSAADEAAGPSEPSTPDCEVAVVFGTRVEAGGLVDLLQPGAATRTAPRVEHVGRLGNRWVALIESGEGQPAAEQATREAIGRHHPAWVISAGFATALSDQLLRGHVLMADEVVDLHGNRRQVPLGLDRTAGADSKQLHFGRLLTVDDLVRRVEARHELGRRYAALACDMESAAVARVCSEAQVRLLPVRIITEAVDDQLPVEVEVLLEQKTLAAKLGAATGALFRRPSSMKDMWQVKEDALKASDRLARFLADLVEQLPQRPAV